MNATVDDHLQPLLNPPTVEIRLQKTSKFQQVHLEDKWPSSLVSFQIVQAWIIHFIIFFVLPFIFLCLASFRLLYAVRMSGRFVRQHCIRGGTEFRNTIREEARMTMLILCLIGAFFTCQAPFVAYSACRKVGILATPSRGHSLLRAFIILALALKSDCTFVFHCWLNQRFALALRRMLCSFATSAGSRRCHVSKSHSGDQNSRSEHTHTLVKHHSIKQPKDKQMKILMHEIQKKHPEGGKINLSNMSKRLRLCQDLRPFHEVRQENTPNDRVGYVPLLKVSSCENPPATAVGIFTDTTQPDSQRKPSTHNRKCCTHGCEMQRFFSENDLCTACTNSACHSNCSSHFLSSTSSCYSLAYAGGQLELCTHASCRTRSFPPSGII